MYDAVAGGWAADWLRMRLRAKPSKGWVLGGLCLLSAALMVLPGSRWLARAARPVLVPLSALGMNVPVSVWTRMDEIAGRDRARPDRRVAELRRLLLAQQEVIDRQRRRMEVLSGWRSKLKGFKCRLIEASVIGAEAVPLQDRRLLDAGSSRKVAPGDLVTTRRLVHERDIALPEGLLVLGRNYLVGRVVDCAAFSATLQLVTDRSFEMPALLWRLVGPGQQRTIYTQGPNGARRKVVVRHDGRGPAMHAVGEPILVKAQGNGRWVVLRDVPAEYGVRRGDLLTSAGSLQFIPFGLRIGQVVRTERSKREPHFVTVYVEPFADLGRLSDVYIIQPVSP